MLTAYLQQASALFDRRFLLAYWAPVFVTAVTAGLIRLASPPAVDPWIIRWNNLDPLLQALVGLGLLLALTAAALVLQAFTTPVLRLYEGYWPARWRRLAEWGLAAQSARRQAAQADAAAPRTAEGMQRALQQLYRTGAYRDGYFSFPRDAALVRPTRLGNTLTAAEEHPYQIYRLDAVLWWPRLAPLLPDTLRSQLDGALTPLLTLLNLSLLSTLLAVGGGGALLARHWLTAAQPLWLVPVVVVGGALSARLCYVAAVVQAAEYGSLVRVAFDLHRHAILQALHIARPTDLKAERRLWAALNDWVYRYIPPWEARLLVGEFPGVTADNFTYDTFEPPTAPPADKPQRIELTVRRETTAREDGSHQE